VTLPPPAPASRSTLRRRLRAMIVTTTTLALLLSSCAYLTYDYFSFRGALEHRLQVMAAVMATQASPALAFNDARVATEILGTLAAAPHIISAAVYARNGSLLSRYQRPDSPDTSIPGIPQPDGTRFEDGVLGIARSISADGDRLGTIYLRSDLDEAWNRLRLSLFLVGLVLILVILLSAMLSDRMIRTINGPIASLVGVVRAVTASRDYSLRAERKGPDELVVLIEGINDMVSQIQVRDGALQLARNELESRVKERTSELTFVNQELQTEIFERTRMEASLRDSEERYRQLVELSPDAILLHRDGRILFANGAALRLFGARTPEELLEIPFKDLVAPEFRELVRGRSLKISQERQSTPPMEQQMIRLNGTVVDVEDQGTPFIFQGTPAVQIVLRDISKRKEIDRMKDEFVSTVSHELRTPLTSIQGSLGLIANGVTGALPAAARPLIDIAYKNCGRLVLLINDILDSEKIAAGKMAFDIQEHELMPILENALESNRSYGVKYGVRFELSGNVGGAKVDVDHDRLIQVLTNLLSNAAKFSPKGGVVTLSTARAAGKLRISVIDRGPGIPLEFRDRMFQKFSQADSSDRRAKGGTGLGLTISKAIIERHGGTLGFESEIGQGTTFTIELPERRPPPERVDEAAARPRALICDDDSSVSDIIRVIVEREGFEVSIAPTLAKAREFLSRNFVEMLVLDFILADGNGVDLLRELRARPALKRLPVLMLSPQSAAARELVGGELGPLDFLDKPIDMRTLAEAVRNILRNAVPT
jgi:PAS domain S-box-containing protein